MKRLLVSGRGGSGKSTLVAFLAKRLSQEAEVLVVDSDESNLGLPVLLGLPRPSKTLMEVLGGKDKVKEELQRIFRGQEVSFFDQGLKLQGVSPEALSRKDGLWFLSIGKEEHALEGCACPMGVLGRDFLRKLDPEGRWILVDTEAGVEHFGRGLVSVVDIVLYVAEPALESFLLLEKAKRMTEEAGRPFLVVANKVQESIKDRFLAMLEERGVQPVAVIPYLESLSLANLLGAEVQELPSSIDDLVRALTEA